MSNDFMHVRCYAYIVSFIACARLKNIRNAVNFVRFSPSRQLVFNQDVNVVNSMVIDNMSDDLTFQFKKYLGKHFLENIFENKHRKHLENIFL